MISGGAGRDQLFGGGDDDSINAFDSEVDSVDCGTSLDDDAQVDAGDQVVGCEYSQRGDIPVPIDADGDGFVALAGNLVFDCNDKSTAVHPGAVDIVDDGIDQDCDGSDEPRPYVEGSLSYQFSKPSPLGSKVVLLRATDLLKGQKLVLTCKTALKRLQRRCPFTRVTRTRQRPDHGSSPRASRTDGCGPRRRSRCGSPAPATTARCAASRSAPTPRRAFTARSASRSASRRRRSAPPTRSRPRGARGALIARSDDRQCRRAR